MFKTLAVSLAVAAAVVVSGCGGSDSADNAKHDAAISKSITLRATDLPGWKVDTANVAANGCPVLKPAGALGARKARPLPRTTSRSRM